MFPTPSFVQHTTAALVADLIAFTPELILCGTIVLMLLIRLVAGLRRVHVTHIALATSTVALAMAVLQLPDFRGEAGPVPARSAYTAFGGLALFDEFGLFLRIFLLAFLVLYLWLSRLTGIPDREDAADYTTLVVGGILGMMLMASANHLLTAFLAVEMASLPSYALAGFLKGKRKGSEAALKYVVYGASASGVMLYGISMLCGVYGTGSLPVIAGQVVAAKGGASVPAAVGAVCVLIGLGFKLSAVPFHFWCPDVFEGAAAEVGAFLSVASKGAALGLTARFLIAISWPSGNADVGNSLGLVWGLFAAVTTTVGNLAALNQTNVKRLFAYSTIAHAGIMMMALVPLNPKGTGPLLFYVASYLLMNLGVFAVIALVRNRTGSEDIEAYRGLGRRSPVLAVTMAIFLLSLLGLPPLAGFAAKFQVFAALYEAGRAARTAEPTIAGLYFGLLAIAALNTAVSAGYYLRIVRAMTLDEPEAGARPIATSTSADVFVTLLAVFVIAIGILWAPLMNAAGRGEDSFTRPTPLSTKVNR